MIDNTINQIYVAGEYAPMINTYPGLNWRFNTTTSSSVCLSNDAFTSSASSCVAGFDYRARSWFLSASYVSKNVILMIDYSSSSLRSSTGYPRSVLAIESLFNGLDGRDKIAVVLFNTKATLYPGNVGAGFIYASEINKAAIKSWIYATFTLSSSVTQGAYYTTVFDTTFAFIKQYSSSMVACDTSIVILGDADTIKDESNPVTTLRAHVDDITNSFSGSEWAKNLRVFSFTVGLEVGQANALKSFACVTNGLWVAIDDASTEQTGDIRGLMSPFFQFHSYRRLGENKGIWSDFYSDVLGVGNMTTAALPCYSSSNNFLGVVGVDVPATLMNSYSNYEAEFVKRKNLANGVAYCPSTSVTTSFINNLRGGACNYCNQPCGALAVMLGFIPGVLVLFVIVVIIAFCLYKRSLAGSDEEKEELTKK